MGLLESSGLDVGSWTPTVPVVTKPPNQTIDVPRLVRALERIDSTPWKPWNTVGLALKNESPELFPIWEWWSKLSSSSNGCDLRAEWDKLQPNGSVTLGTVYYLGKQDDSSTFETYTLDHLLNGDFRVTYLIDGMLVAGQPCLCFGPQKSLKTSVLLYKAICLSMGKPFLGHRCDKCRVLFMSGESGLATLQETAKRQIESLGGEYDADYFHLSPQLPRFDQPLDALENLLVEKRTEVLFVDPAYLCLAGSDANNMFIMGQQLANIANLCTKLGITLVVAHHSTKQAGKENKPLELADMAWSGFGEFARQWLMLSRREPYVDGSGEHRLYLRAGGSAGHSNLLHLDISEGVYPVRHWNIHAESHAVSAATMRDKQFADDVAKVRIVLTEPMCQNPLRNATGINASRWPETLERMLKEGIVEPATDGTRPKYRLAEKT